jgi:hypothetical protein
MGRKLQTGLQRNPETSQRVLDLSSSDKRLTRAHHRAWGEWCTAAIGKTAKSETKMPRRPAQLTQADIARAISAAKQAGASEAYTNNWNAVALI